MKEPSWRARFSCRHPMKAGRRNEKGKNLIVCNNRKRSRLHARKSENNRIIQPPALCGRLFEQIPFSEAAFAAKEKIIAALEAESAGGRDFESLVTAYPTLGSLAVLAGYPPSDADAWRSRENLLSAEALKTAFKKKRRSVYLLMIPLCVALAYIAYAVVYRSVYHAALVLAMLGLAFWAYKKRPATPRGGLSLDAYGYMKQLHDKYSKSTFNTLFLRFVLLARLVFGALCVSANSARTQEVLKFVVTNISAFEFFLLLLGKNFLLSKWTNDILVNKKTRQTGVYLSGALLISAVYWAAVIIMFVLFNTSNWITFYIAVGVYAVLALAFDLTLRKRITFRNIRVNKPRIAIVGVLAVALGFYFFMRKDVWLTQPFINVTPNISETKAEISYDDGSGVYTITKSDDRDFRILQLTDIHLGGSITSYPNDMKALNACFDLIQAAKPDLVVVMGDLCYPLGISSFSLNNTAPVQQFAAFMRNTGVPWAFTYGNHDTEAMAAKGKESLNTLYMRLSWKTSKNLLYPYAQPDIMGRNNQVIEVRNADGTLNSALFLIDSNAYVGQGFSKYDYIRDEQVDWYAENVRRLFTEAGRTLPSYCFFHIPLQEYATADALYRAGSDEAIYCFGFNGESKVCASEYPSKLFDTALELGSTRGFFCGHDHYNNMSLEYKGLRLTYGMSIDYLATPGIAKHTAQRGGTLIVLDKDGEMTLSQIPLTSIRTDQNANE